MLCFRIFLCSLKTSFLFFEFADDDEQKVNFITLVLIWTINSSLDKYSLDDLSWWCYVIQFRKEMFRSEIRWEFFRAESSEINLISTQINKKNKLQNRKYLKQQQLEVKLKVKR